MARIKNAITKYEFQPITEKAEAEEWYELAKWIQTVEDSSEDVIDEAGYYDGDGTAEENVNARKTKYTFSGFYDDEDKAMKYMRKIENETGDKRKVNFRVTDTDGTTSTGKATVTNIITRGGEAIEYPTFSCTISRDEKPEIKPKEGTESL